MREVSINHIDENGCNWKASAEARISTEDKTQQNMGGKNTETTSFYILLYCGNWSLVKSSTTEQGIQPGTS